MHRRLFLVLLAGLAVPTVLAPKSAAAGVAYLVGLAAIVAVLWTASARWTGAARRGWRFVAAAASCWFAGDALQRAFEFVGHPFEQAGPSDVCWLASYPLLVLGIGAMVRGRGVPAALWREIRLDVIAVTVAGSAGVWKLMIQPGIDGGTLSANTVLSVLYPLGDLAIGGIALVLLMTPGHRGAATRCVLACFGLTLLLDTAYAVLPSLLPSFEAARLDGMLLLANGLLAVAAAHPGGGELAERPERSEGPSRAPSWRVVMLGAALVFVSVVSALPAGGSPAVDRAVLLLAAATLSVTILWRMYGVMRARDTAEALLTFRAHHDELTGLANRALLVERLGREIGDPGGRPQVMLCYLDLDGFKAINDSRGHAAGDHVLRTVADRLLVMTRHGDTVARLGGDEFVVMCRDVPAGHAGVLGTKLSEAVRHPIMLPDGSTVQVGVSIGVYAAGHAAVEAPAPCNVDDVLRAADTAMYRAKHAGGGVRVA